MVKVIVYYKGKRLDIQTVNVDSSKDAIIKTICKEGYPMQFVGNKTLEKVTVKRFNETKKRVENGYAIHTVRKVIDITGQSKQINEYWIL